MVALTEKEIIAELSRLGFYAPAEVRSCFKEYTEYCSSRNNAKRPLFVRRILKRVFSAVLPTK